jgi:hypothetical protein
MKQHLGIIKMIERSDPEQIDAAENDPLLQMAEMAKAANLKFTDNNAAARTREILEAEYADYLLKRMCRVDVQD